MEAEVKNLAETHGINHILNLINMYEMRAKGVDMKAYTFECKKNYIDLQTYEILEMKSPIDSPETLSSKIILPIIENLQAGKGSTKYAIHCQAGVGRAGTIVSCLLI
jgi:protein-tyrosine phosphatase